MFTVSPKGTPFYYLSVSSTIFKCRGMLITSARAVLVHLLECRGDSNTNVSNVRIFVSVSYYIHLTVMLCSMKH